MDGLTNEFMIDPMMGHPRVYVFASEVEGVREPSLSSAGQVIGEAVNWMGRKIKPLADAVNPKLYFHPLMALGFGVELYARLSGKANPCSWGRSIKNFVLPSSALFSIVALSSILRTNIKDLFPGYAHTHPHTPHNHAADSIDFVRKQAGVFDDLSAFGNHGTRHYLEYFNWASASTLKSLADLNFYASSARNVLSFTYYAAMTCYDLGGMMVSAWNKGEVCEHKLKCLINDDLAPLVRYGAGLTLNVIQWYTLPASATVKCALNFVNFASASYIVWNGGNAGSGGGGGCC